MPFLTNFFGGIGLKLLAGVAIVGAVLAVLAGARSAGRNAERVDQLRKTLEVKREWEKAASARPRTRDDLIDRLRNGA